LYREADDSNHSITPPAENLDPLQNPLLNQHMGRWAEVYCTTPPEQRDQAVSELLHELEAEEREHPPVSLASRSATRTSEIEARKAPTNAPVRCPYCGYPNRADYRFCGSCRGELRAPDFNSGPSAADNSTSSATAAWRREDVSQRDMSLALASAGSEEFSDGQADELSAPLDDNDTDPSDSNSFRFSSYGNPSHSSYRVYLGVVLALIIAFLLYRAWWSTKSAADRVEGPSRVPPAAASTPSRTPSAEPATPSSTRADVQPKQTVVPAASVAAPTHAKAIGELPSQPTPALARNQTTLTGSLPQSSSGNGATEFSQAEDLWNGSDGKPRNRAEAVTLLWEAVGKQNAAATELLAVAYLTGDGVAQNCDQARLLLDAAARKGRKDAGERLRHMQAFGCQ